MFSWKKNFGLRFTLRRSRENKHGGQLSAPGAAGDGDFWRSVGGQVQETRRKVRGESDQHPPSV